MTSLQKNYKPITELIKSGIGKIIIITTNPNPTELSWILTKLHDEKDDLGIILPIDFVFCVITHGFLKQKYHQAFLELQEVFRCTKLIKLRICYDTSDAPDPLTDLVFTQNDCSINTYSLNDAGFQKISVSSDFLSRTEEAFFCEYFFLEDHIIISPNEPIGLSAADLNNLERVTLSLLKRGGKDLGNRSGLNWGQRNGRNKNEAYIPVPIKIARLGFFPVSDDHTNPDHFLALTDDSKTLLLRIEQQNNKALTTPASNALLGEYFRNRLGLANGQKVLLDDLLRYGRTDVEFIKLDVGEYYMDFSKPNKK